MNAARLSLFQAAWVIARRDFLAILFSRAFLLFLIGPLFFAAISVGAGTLGAKAASSASPPRLAVVLPAEQARAFDTAYSQLDTPLNLPQMEVADPGTSPAQLLADKSRNFGAVLTGSLEAPRLVGTPERIARWQGEIAVITARALGDETGLPTVTLEPTQSSSASVQRAQTATATASMTLLFLLTMLLAGMVLSNLVEEKANKIIEILAASIPMDAVFVGKLFAMLGVSLVGIAVWGSVAGIVIALGGAALPALPVPAVGWPIFIALFLIYFALAYLLIGSVFLGVGSMAATVRDVQTLSMPATILQLATFFFANYAMSDANPAVTLAAKIVPLSSPYIMIATAAQDGALWPHALAIAWQVAWVAIFVMVGSRLFRRRVMKSGPAPKKKTSALARLRLRKA